MGVSLHTRLLTMSLMVLLSSACGDDEASGPTSLFSGNVATVGATPPSDDMQSATRAIIRETIGGGSSSATTDNGFSPSPLFSFSSAAQGIPLDVFTKAAGTVAKDCIVSEDGLTGTCTSVEEGLFGGTLTLEVTFSDMSAEALRQQMGFRASLQGL